MIKEYIEKCFGFVICLAIGAFALLCLVAITSGITC